MELFRANSQWAKRPDDERFESIKALYEATKGYALNSAEKSIDAAKMRVEADAECKEVVLVGKQGVTANFTHYSFGQLASRVKAPADYLRALPPTLAVQNLNHGLKRYGEDLGNLNVLFHKNGNFVVRAMTSDKYFRVWNYEIAERLMDLERMGWQVPPARPASGSAKGVRKATEADVLRAGESGLAVRVGDLIAPAGIYASDHDMFVFMVNEQVRVNDGSEHGLAKGCFFSNSEVGDASIRLTKFLYRTVCGNHIVWGAKDVEDIRIRHIGGTVHDQMRQMFDWNVRKYANDSVSDMEAKIKSARTVRIAQTKEDVLDTIFGKRILSYKAAEKAYNAVLEDVDGDPKTVWGFVQGITRASQDTPFADERVDFERASAKVLAAAF